MVVERLDEAVEQAPFVPGTAVRGRGRSPKPNSTRSELTEVKPLSVEDPAETSSGTPKAPIATLASTAMVTRRRADLRRDGAGSDLPRRSI